MAEGTMHWSKPGGMKFLAAVRRCGWSATTWQVAEITGSLNVHCDAASARCLLESIRVPDPYNAIPCRFSHTTDAGRRVYEYSIRADVIDRVRRLLDGPKPERPKPPRAVQTALL